MTRVRSRSRTTSKMFTVKDSGVREQFDSGMVRDTTEGKTDYALVLDGPMFKRWATHLTKGAIKYAKRNWMQANGDAELERFKESALRHFIQWYYGDRDEDHAAAVFFNINGAEYVREQRLELAPECGSAVISAPPGAMISYPAGLPITPGEMWCGDPGPHGYHSWGEYGQHYCRGKGQRGNG